MVIRTQKVLFAKLHYNCHNTKSYSLKTQCDVMILDRSNQMEFEFRFSITFFFYSIYYRNWEIIV